MTGTYEHSIDAKGRLFIPAKLREELGVTFYLAMGVDECLAIYPQETWNRFTEKFASLPMSQSAAMRPLFDDPAVIAVGEIGLDHHWPLPAQEQYDLFEAQLQLAQELDLPVSVHDREAHAEMYELLRQYRPRGVLHCYSGSAEDAAWLTAQGMALGFGGAVTYKGAKRAAKVLAMVPHELAVLETDCPYMSPEPVRGTRNDSRNIAYVAAKIGEIWQMDAQSVLDLTAENAKRIFNQ